MMDIKIYGGGGGGVEMQRGGAGAGGFFLTNCYIWRLRDNEISERVKSPGT